MNISCASAGPLHQVAVAALGILVVIFGCALQANAETEPPPAFRNYADSSVVNTADSAIPAWYLNASAGAMFVHGKRLTSSPGMDFRCGGE